MPNCYNVYMVNNNNMVDESVDGGEEREEEEADDEDSFSCNSDDIEAFQLKRNR